MKTLMLQIIIWNIKDKNGCISGKVYDPNDFDDKYLLYKQYLRASTLASTLTMLDFSNNQETIQRRDFFTANASETIYIDMRNLLGYTGKKDPLKRDDSSINVEISLRDAAEWQGFGEFVYQSGKDGNMIPMYKYKVVKEKKSKKLDDIKYRES